jgi:hypothetical protein
VGAGVLEARVGSAALSPATWGRGCARRYTMSPRTAPTLQALGPHSALPVAPVSRASCRQLRLVPSVTPRAVSYASCRQLRLAVSFGGSGFETRSGVIPRAALLKCGHSPLVD